MTYRKTLSHRGTEQVKVMLEEEVIGEERVRQVQVSNKQRRVVGELSWWWLVPRCLEAALLTALSLPSSSDSAGCRLMLASILENKKEA